MRILIAEDDDSIANAIAALLRDGGHVVDIVDRGACAERAFAGCAFDLLVLDLGLPDLDGTHVLARIRQRGNGVPILVITARDTVNDRVRVLDLGADDYLVKPFALSELDARIRALLRRSLNRGASVLRLGRLSLDLPGQRALVDGEPLELTRRELGLLSALATRMHRITSRQQLMEGVCSWDDELTDNGLDIALYRLRRKLQRTGVTLRTVRGLGYVIEAGQDV